MAASPIPSSLLTDPVRISPVIFWSLVVCVVLCVLLCIYVILFRSVNVARLSPTCTVATNTSAVVDNGSIRKTGQGSDLYTLNVTATPSAAAVWCNFTIVPDNSFNASNVVGVSTFGTSSTDGTSTTTPTEILQIFPVCSGSTINVKFLSNSVYTHNINLQFIMQ